jgi:hypothetical protein
MKDKSAGRGRFDWRLPVGAAAGAMLVFFVFAIHGDGWGELLYIIIAAPIISLSLLIVAICWKGQRRSMLAMLAVYWVVTLGLSLNFQAVRSAGRWFFWSKIYKQEVLAQAASDNGELRHIEWDGWGFAGVGDTVVYLVFDPSNGLAKAAQRQAEGKFDGIPCKVFQVHRLESDWYSVLFYADTTWNQCG